MLNFLCISYVDEQLIKKINCYSSLDSGESKCQIDVLSGLTN
jgi:hypothetical protein